MSLQYVKLWIAFADRLPRSTQQIPLCIAQPWRSMLFLRRSIQILFKYGLLVSFEWSDFSHTFWFLQIKTPAQLEAAFSFLSITGSDDFKSKEFDEACGVGKTKFSHYLTWILYITVFVAWLLYNTTIMSFTFEVPIDLCFFSILMLMSFYYIVNLFVYGNCLY